MVERFQIVWSLRSRIGTGHHLVRESCSVESQWVSKQGMWDTELGKLNIRVGIRREGSV